VHSRLLRAPGDRGEAGAAAGHGAGEERVDLKDAEEEKLSALSLLDVLVVLLFAVLCVGGGA
jgi:hypothetical protein